MAELLSEWCNVYGVESGGARLLGGLSQQKVGTQWACKSRAVGRFIMVCEHGHKGQMMPLCESHFKQYSGGKVQFCPRCNSDPNFHHRCALKLQHVS